MDFYAVLVLLHVLAAIVWVGGAVVVQLQGAQVIAGGDQTIVRHYLSQTERIGTLVFVPMALLLVATGVALTWMRWSFMDLWIQVGLATFILSFLAGAAVIGPALGKLKAILAEGPSRFAEAGPYIKRLTLIARIELLLLVLTVALMVVKPA